MTTHLNAQVAPVNMHSTSVRRELQSGSALLASATLEQQTEFLNALSSHDLQALPWLFEFWALPHQVEPEGDWRTWVIMGGRGAGKTRAGAEWVRSMVEGDMPLDEGRARRVALVGETFDQVRDIMVFGDSGIIACSPPDRKPHWNATKRRLEWANGAIAEAHSASSPEALRGPQFDAAWVDELGCAAINKATNQPNKFLDPKSSESAIPYFSDGRRDDYIQMQYLRAYFDHFGSAANNPISPLYGEQMVDMSKAFVWAWDGRPWPDFPNNLTLWSDGPNYAHGHWLNGRTGVQSLADVVGIICEKSGIDDCDTTDLHGVVRGYSVADIQTARASLQPLMVTFGFDTIEKNGTMFFRNREIAKDVEIDSGSLVLPEGDEAVAEHIRAPEAEIIGQARLGYIEAEGEFVARVADARFPDDSTPVSSQNDLPLALISSEARSVTERWLSESRIARDTIRFTLPPSCCDFGAGDLVRFSEDFEQNRLWRIDRIETGTGRAVEAVRIEKQVYHPSQGVEELSEIRPFSTPLPLEVQFLDIPLLRGSENPVAPYVAVSANPWSGGAAVYGSSDNSDYSLNTVIETQSVIGTTLSGLAKSGAGLWDRGAAVTVKLSAGALSSANETSVLNGANACAIGDGSTGNWEVFQFAQADLVAPFTYDLTMRLRGQAGTDALIPAEWPVGSRFVLLNQALTQIDFDAASRGLDRHYRIGPVTKSYSNPVYGHFVRNVEGVGLRPYAPAHLKVRAVADDLYVSWIRRARIDGDSWLGPSVPLSEDVEHYVLNLIQAGRVVREVILDQPSWIYSSNLRTLDGPIDTIEVAQVSQSFGAGLFTRKLLNV